MKKCLLGLLILFTINITAEEYNSSIEESKLSQILKNGIFSTDLEVFYMDRSFDKDKSSIPNTKALTVGGILKYESDNSNKFKFGFAYYGSHKIGDLFTREEGTKTNLLQSNGDDVAFLGEAYFQYTLNNIMFKIGRQRLSTPLINDHDLRLLPSVYEAAIIKNENLSNTLLEMGYLKRYSGFVSKLSKFDNQDNKWGKDGLGYMYIKNNSVKNLTLNAQYIKALSNVNKEGAPISIQDYKNLDMKYDFFIGNDTYLQAQYGGNSYKSASDSSLFGLKLGTNLYNNTSIVFLYNKITGNEFKVVEAGPVYSDWFQGYNNFEESQALGGQVTFNINKDLSTTLGYVQVESFNKKNVDDFNELIFDGKYNIDNNSKIRVIYSKKDQSNASEQLRYDNDILNGGNEDRNDFRIIYSLSF